MTLEAAAVAGGMRIEVRQLGVAGASLPASLVLPDKGETA